MRTSFTLPSMRASVRRAAALVALFALAGAIASCSLSRSLNPKRTFLLDPAMPAAAAAAKPAAVRVGVVNVGAPFRGKAFVYRQDELKYEADFYNEFFVAPAAMLSETTARAVAAANVFRRVIPPGATPDDGDYVLDGFASELYGDARDPAKPAAVLSVTFYLSSASSPIQSVVWSREYRQRTAFTGNDPEALARAWNTALTAVYADLARDLAALNLPK